MKMITPNWIILVLGLVISACQLKSSPENPIIQVLFPAVLRETPLFQERLVKKQLLLEVFIRSDDEVIWTQRLPMDFATEIDIPASVFERYEEKPLTVFVEVWDRPTNLAPSLLLAGRRKMEDTSLEIYLSLIQPLSPRDPDAKVGFD
jgi:hypothetical protein